MQPVAGTCCWEDRWRTGRPRGRTRAIVLMAQVADRMKDRARLGFLGQIGAGRAYHVPVFSVLRCYVIF